MRRLLLVDPDGTDREALLKRLGQHGWLARQADGVSAIEEIERNRPHVVLVAKGSNGPSWAAAGALRRRLGDSAPPLVALSDRGRDDERAQSEAAGCTAYAPHAHDVIALARQLEALLTPFTGTFKRVLRLSTPESPAPRSRSAAAPLLLYQPEGDDGILARRLAEAGLVVRVVMTVEDLQKRAELVPLALIDLQSLRGGLGALRALRLQCPRTLLSVLALRDRRVHADVGAIIAAGADDVVDRPVDPLLVRHRLSNLLTMRRSRKVAETHRQGWREAGEGVLLARLDGSGAILEAAGAWKQLLGRDPSTMASLELRELVLPAEQARLPQLPVREKWQGRHRLTHELRGAPSFDLTVSPLPPTLGGADAGGFLRAVPAPALADSKPLRLGRRPLRLGTDPGTGTGRIGVLIEDAPGRSVLVQALRVAGYGAAGFGVVDELLQADREAALQVVIVDVEAEGLEQVQDALGDRALLLPVSVYGYLAVGDTAGPFGLQGLIDQVIERVAAKLAAS